MPCQHRGLRNTLMCGALLGPVFAAGSTDSVYYPIEPLVSSTSFARRPNPDRRLSSSESPGK